MSIGKVNGRSGKVASRTRLDDGGPSARPARGRRWPRLALVLSGGGARGAMQVGALRALVEAGVRPDFMVGTSIGAVNAAYMALHGWSEATVDSLVETWRQVAKAGLLPTSYLGLALGMLRRRKGSSLDRMRRFFREQGLSPETRFGDLREMMVIVVAADLKAGRLFTFGADPADSLTDALLATTAMAPWLSPLEVDGRLLMDGGVVSNLPIEAALAHGATSIIALDLLDPPSLTADSRGLSLFFDRLMLTVEQRHCELELALARARGIPVQHIALKPPRPVPFWDFGQLDMLFASGYALAKSQLPRRAPPPRPWHERLRGLLLPRITSQDR